MQQQRAAASSVMSEPRRRRLETLTGLSLAEAFVIQADGACAADGVHAAVIADHRLHHAGDYRAALQAWFGATRVGGHLVIIVPHAFLRDRQITLPATWEPQQRRLYTPASLAGEIEEALEPNSYRVRMLCDDDQQYDYSLSLDTPPSGACDIVLMIERIRPPAWTLLPQADPAPAEPALFYPPATRVEIAARRPAPARILLLKLDHLGDFVLAVPALRQLRAAFPQAHIELVVGPWNADLARDCGLVDTVTLFSVFPRNASEEAVDVRGQRALFETILTGHYDIAIDLRTDADTRFLLAGVSADVRAGLGNSEDHPFLDIFLPIDHSRDGRETSTEALWDHGAFASSTVCSTSPYRTIFMGSRRPKRGALLWGPYRRLRHGSYIFQPRIEIEAARQGATLTMDVVLDDSVLQAKTVTSGSVPDFEFEVGPEGGVFQFRLWAPRWKRAFPFSFYGGKLYRRGSANVLHQSEYLALLVHLVTQRLQETGHLVAPAA
ncbi:glycosyltransferase family 9 protein [Sphingomonas sp. HT-1]|uniref:glycosyltransferase family 9 protein n=1 Tax=unclassified Sphingomonas TaxID=196159 RepID=UPI000319BAE8|nr:MULTISPECIES: hypothetical protein [unclassified Sphingomonas]